MGTFSVPGNTPSQAARASQKTGGGRLGRLEVISAASTPHSLSNSVQAGLIEPSRVIAYDPVPTALDNLTRAVQGVRRAGGNRQVVEESDVVFLAVKPQHVNPALADLRPAVASSKLFVSIAAGITIARLCDSLGMGRVIRVMPNTPCLVGRGAAGLAGERGA